MVRFPRELALLTPALIAASHQELGETQYDLAGSRWS
jgi:hypothetical protein